MHDTTPAPDPPRHGPPGEWGGRPRWILLAVLVLAAAGAVAVALTGRGSKPAPRPRAAAPVPRIVAPPRPVAPRSDYAAVVDRLAHHGSKVYCGSAHGNQVALTFDDGPGPETVPILAQLVRAHIPATFFLIGRNAQANPKLPRLEARLGMALGDHTETHPDLTRLSAADVKGQIADARDAISATAGIPVSLFRPPYGARNARVDAQARAQGLLEVLWDVDTRDSERATSATILANARRGLRGGSIVLMHEDPTTVTAMPAILRSLRERHLEAVTIPQLVAGGHRTKTCPYIPNTE
jgi:peptidoglycan/xylan/chitin deacetylase (PgdA/CDA1 family)